MKITRENYEVFFIDLMDGNLSDSMVDEVLDFMRDNPDLAAELDGLDNIKVETPKVSSFNKNVLLKTDFQQPEIFEETCVRSIEGDLSDSEEKAFKSYIGSHAKAQKEYQLFQATISEPNPFIIYENKEKIKRKAKIVPYWYAAAAAIVLASIFWFNRPIDNQLATPVQQVALYESIPVEEVIQLKKTINTIEENNRSVAAKLNDEIIPHNRLESLPTMESEIEYAFTFATLESEFVLEEIPMNPIFNRPYYPTISEYLAQEIRSIDTRKGFQKITYFALDKLKDISNNKLDYNIQQNGSLSQIQYNSRLLAFSIPVNTKEN